MSYKSNPVSLFFDFLVKALSIFFITGLLITFLMARLEYLDLDNIVEILVIIAVISIIAAVYFAFYRNNIKVDVTNTTISFLRGKTVYLCLPYSDFIFGSYVVKHRLNYIPTGTSRYLRAMSKNTDKDNDFLCYNFDRITFEEFIAYIRKMQHEYEQKHGSEEDFYKKIEPSQISVQPIEQELSMSESYNFSINNSNFAHSF